jgi:hypothetical protein
LALGIPTVVQDTGFSKIIPSGEGILAFETLEEAGEAIANLRASPEQHAKAARTIAAEYFDSRLVLERLVEKALAGSP